jgi:adenylate kinase
MRIVFIGPPGSGKGTQAARLADRLDMVHLSTGEVLRQARDSGSQLGLEAASYFESGRLVPDALVMQIVAERLEELGDNSCCLFDGFPRTLPQAEALDLLLAVRGMPLDRVIEFDVDRAEILRRLSSRGRLDDNEETVNRRLDLYETETRPLVDYYRQRGVLRTIKATGNIDEIAELIEKTVTEA